MTTDTNEPQTYGVSPMDAVLMWQDEYSRAKMLFDTDHLAGWTLDFDRAFKSLGQTKYRQRTVSLSVHYLPRATVESLRDTIRHELAHVIAGHAAGHGNEWKRVALALGASPEREGMEDLGPRPVPLYAGTAEPCGCKAVAHRLSKRHAYFCGPHENRIVWRKTR